MNPIGEITSRSMGQTEASAAELAVALGKPPFDGFGLILLKGPLGAGKTAWTRGFARGLAIKSDVHSPSYTVMNVYRDGEKVLYHLDLYRLNCLEEVADIGLFEIIDAGNLCVVEWAERVPDLDRLPHLLINIDIEDTESRRLSWRMENKR